MTEWIQAHLHQGGILGAIAVALYFLVKWFLKREIKRWDDKLSDHETRIRAMESGRVTHDDIDELRMSLMATITNSNTMLSKRMDDVRDDIARLTQFLLGGGRR